MENTNNPEVKCALCQNIIAGQVHKISAMTVRNLEGYDKRNVVNGNVTICTGCKTWYDGLD